MALLKLIKELTGTGKSIFRYFDLKSLNLLDEYLSDDISNINGVYFEEVQKILIAIFSNESKNYIYLETKLIELTQDISIKYYCGERAEKSWIKIFDKETIIFELEYLNPISYSPTSVQKVG